MLTRFKTVIIAVILGIVPYFLFIGSTNTVTLNGVVVRDEQFNFLGVVLALIGLGMAFSALKPSAPKDRARKGLAVVAGLLCALQLAVSMDIVRPLDWFNPESDMPRLAYDGLSEGNRGIVQSIVDRGDSEELTRSFVIRMASMLGRAEIHMAYADVCFEGRYRIDHDALVALMEPLPQAEQQAVHDSVEVNRRTRPTPEDCGPQRTAYAMGELVDSLNQDRDMITILRDGYVAQNL